ncbi:hypothetical protein BJX66DRAFT_335035 [Aspergillus keveii]|uniref:F-box domain-containing protein n=1 Tax=Aspergillus keveii TaxID=714993 RepID=A0ABR4GFL2_9EURO
MSFAGAQLIHYLQDQLGLLTPSAGSFEKLPVELIEIIAQFLDHGALLAFRITCRYFARCTHLKFRPVTAWQETLRRLPSCRSFSVNPKAKNPPLDNSGGCKRETYSADGRLIAADALAMVLWFISEWSRLNKSVSLDVCLDDFYLASASTTTAYGLPAQSTTVFSTLLVHHFHDSTAEGPDRFLAHLPRNLASIESLTIRDKGDNDVLQYLLSETPQLRKLETANVPAYNFFRSQADRIWEIYGALQLEEIVLH